MHLREFIPFSFLSFRLVEADGSGTRNPGIVLGLVKFIDVRFYSREVSAIFVVQVNDIEHIVPQVVVIQNVFIEATKFLLFKFEPSLVTDVALVSLVVNKILVIFTHGSKSVNNDTEENIE
jgi:hypothetical protein